MKKVLSYILGLSLVLVFASAISPILVDAQSTLTATILAPANNATYSVGQSISFNGIASGGTAPYAYVWDMDDGIQRFGQSASISYSTTGVKTIVLTTTDIESATASTTISLNITGTSTELTISNVQVTNITQTGATITWDTNLAANSRVIYDTVSHSDISGASAPNYGYAASTATYDSTTGVTSHSVALTGLNPGTRYYFRVISE